MAQRLDYFSFVCHVKAPLYRPHSENVWELLKRGARNEISRAELEAELTRDREVLAYRMRHLLRSLSAKKNTIKDAIEKEFGGPIDDIPTDELVRGFATQVNARLATKKARHG